MADKADKWDASRTKFPENLKPFLKAAMEAAYQHGLWNDRIEDGYNKAVCSTLPYNQLTLSVSLLLDSRITQTEADDLETGIEAWSRAVLELPKSMRRYWTATNGRFCEARAGQVDRKIR
jgi:hypothetical protein